MYNVQTLAHYNKTNQHLRHLSHSQPVHTNHIIIWLWISKYFQARVRNTYSSSQNLSAILH